MSAANIVPMKRYLSIESKNFNANSRNTHLT